MHREQLVNNGAHQQHARPLLLVVLVLHKKRLSVVW